MSPSPNSISVIMPVAEVSPRPEGSAWVCCLNCGSKLDLHQPESQEPERLVGTCDQCGRWYLLDWHPGSAEGLMLLLPDHQWLLSAFRGKQGGK